MPKTKSFSIAMAYCGAVIGAGFATGREVVDFFTTYGSPGLVGVLVATGLFVWAGIVILNITHQEPVYSYIDLLKYLLRFRVLVVVVDLLFLATLLVGVGVMTAAGGAILADWGLWYPGGCAIFLGTCVTILRAGGRGFVKVNAWLVPGLAVMIVGLCLAKLALPVVNLPRPGVYGSALLYAAYNIAIAAVALSTLKGQLNKKAAFWGGLGGGLLVGALLLAIYLATQSGGHSEIPMLDVASAVLGRWQWIYQLTLAAAVLTTALANMHGLASRVTGKSWYQSGLVIIAVMGLVISQYGFANLVGLFYPLLGLCNIVLLAGLCYYSVTRLTGKLNR